MNVACWSLRRVCHAFDAGGIAIWPDQNEVVVHCWISLHAMAFGDELLLRNLCMREHNIGIAAPRIVERLTSAHCDNVHSNAGLLREEGQ